MMSALEVTSGPGTHQEIQWLWEGDPAIRWQALQDLAKPRNGPSNVSGARSREGPEHWRFRRRLDYKSRNQ